MWSAVYYALFVACWSLCVAVVPVRCVLRVVRRVVGGWLLIAVYCVLFDACCCVFYFFLFLCVLVLFVVCCVLYVVCCVMLVVRCVCASCVVVVR